MSLVGHKKTAIVYALQIGVASVYVAVETSVCKYFVTGRTTIPSRWHVLILKVSLSVPFDTSLATKKTDETRPTYFHLSLH